MRDNSCLTTMCDVDGTAKTRGLSISDVTSN